MFVFTMEGEEQLGRHAGIAVDQGEICIRDVAEYASTMRDLVVTKLSVSLEGYLPLILLILLILLI